MIETDLGGARG